MKKLIWVIATIMLMVIGCAGGQVKHEPIIHKLELSVSSETQTPVKVEVKEDQINRSMEVQNPEMKLSALSAISTKHKRAYIKLFSGLSVSDLTRTWNDIIYLYDFTEIRELNVFISSPGGDAFTGLALADLLIRAKGMGFKVIGHASGIVASAAVPVLAVCTERIAGKDTIFMVHEAALWKWPGRETASDIRAQGELMELLKTRYLNKLADHTKLDYEKWEIMEVKTKWFGADKALDWGLIDRIE